MRVSGTQRLLLSAIALLWAGSAQAQSPDDAAAVARGERAVAWIQSYECPRPGRPLTVQSLGTDADIQRALDENWAFMQSSLNARLGATRQRERVVAELQAEGSSGSAAMQRSLTQLDDALRAVDYRVATTAAQWALANYVLMSRAPGDFNILDGRVNPLAEFVPVVQALENLTGQFGEPTQQVYRRFRDCWVAANDVYLDAAGPIVQQRLRSARTVAEVDRILALVTAMPSNPELPGGAVVAEAQTKRADLIAEAEREAERQRAASDQAARARLEREANETLSLARRYINAIGSGAVNEASQLLSPNVRLVSPEGNASGRSAVVERMRAAQQRGEQVSMGAPQITSGYRVESRLTSSRGSGTMSFQSSGGLITLIELRQR